VKNNRDQEPTIKRGTQASKIQPSNHPTIQTTHQTKSYRSQRHAGSQLPPGAKDSASASMYLCIFASAAPLVATSQSLPAKLSQFKIAFETMLMTQL